MRRRATVGAGLLSSLMLGTVALGALGPAASASGSAGAAEFHAPRIPGPTPMFRPEVVPAVQSWVARNWSGYAVAVTGKVYTSVVGNWTVPQVQTPTKFLRRNRYSSTWVGIDGFNNQDLIQAGTEQDWLDGTKFYQAWWEILPAAETPIGSLAIHPGDAMSVSITEGVASLWTITVTDDTTHEAFTTLQRYFGPRASAEWIQEAPTIGRHVATLADDSNAVFDLGTLNQLNPALTTSESGVMVKDRRQVSTPSAPNPNRDGFAVAYGSIAPPAPSS